MRFKPDKKYVYWGVTAFLVIIACLFVSFMFYNFSAFSKGISKFSAVLTPVVNGFIIAYLLSPLMDFFEYRALPSFCKMLKINEEKSKKPIHYSSVFLSIFCLLLVIYAFFQLLVPQLISSTKSIINSFPEYLVSFNDFVDDLFKNNEDLNELVTSYSGDIEDFFNKNAMPQLNEAISNLSSGIYTGISSGISFVRNLILGLILSIYILASKDMFLGQFRKVLFAILNRKTAKNIVNEMHFINFTFQNYIVSSVVDSTIIGILCFVTCLILGIPFPTLISVIVGVTNIIPFFGPFLGAIPSAFLILLAEPIKCLYFLILILVLQQCDGNLIKPKLFGSSTGLPGFWVLFSILVGGGLFGIPGMYLGVPVFAVIYIYTKKTITKKLSSKGLPTSTHYYMLNGHQDNKLDSL
ncbi:AI-2E family transporter [Lachnospiraceae bacterium C1.1]|nr:AI-2E family transporter [Lachnospiraceae bacterium C1.1]